MGRICFCFEFVHCFDDICGENRKTVCFLVKKGFLKGVHFLQSVSTCYFNSQVVQEQVCRLSQRKDCLFPIFDVKKKKKIKFRLAVFTGFLWISPLFVSLEFGL